MPLSVDPAKLRQARLDAGMPKEAVALRVEVSYPAITGYESGTITPRLPKLLALARLYDRSVEDLCSEAPEPAI